MWPSRKRPGRKDGFDADQAFESDGASSDTRPSTERKRFGHPAGRSVSESADASSVGLDRTSNDGATHSELTRTSDARRTHSGASRVPSRLSDFATGRSFDPPESAEASEFERKPGREKPKRSLKMRAIGFLSRREYSRVELERKLKPFVEDQSADGADDFDAPDTSGASSAPQTSESRTTRTSGTFRAAHASARGTQGSGRSTGSPSADDAPAESLEEVLNALEREGWLSDQRFAQSVVHRRSGRFGTSRIIGELKRNAVDSELVEQVAGELRDTERSRAYAVWSKKFSSLPTTAAERGKQARFLASRGFSSAAITAVFKGGEWLEEAGGDIGE